MMRPRLFSLAIFCALPAGALSLPAQPAARIEPAASPFERLRFRNIGPATMGGRIDDFAVLESNPAIYYVATATGGLWKTMNNGTTWEVLFDDQEVVSIGDVAIAPDDANLVWVGTGENNNRQSGSWGNGIYRSTDGGQTWKHLGLTETRHIARVVVDPVDHDVVYVAALGHLWGPNRDRGIYKTIDGGLTWTPVLQVDEHTGATELVMDPSNNKVLYAATYQRRRSSWGFNGGGPGSAIWKSTDAGRTWTKLTRGLPEGPLGRIGLDIYRRNPSVLYARVEHATASGLYRSDDAGLSWRKMSDMNPRPMYFSQVRIDPNDDHRIYVLGVELHMSDDGGRTFVGNTVPHSDHHAMWINPANSNHVLTGCDGGVNVSYDRGRTWDFIDNLDIGQFYHVGYDMDTPYRVLGGLQDNASWMGPSAVRADIGIGNFDWLNIGSGDGFVTLADPNDSRTIYSESQGGNMIRVDRLSLERKNIRPVPARGDPPLRWNWDTPMQISPHSSSTVYVAANRVFRSIDRGDTWQVISPDLTARINRDTLRLMGVAASDITIARNDGVSSYGTIVSFAESPKKVGLYYTGADDGTVYVSRDGGGTWTNLTGRFPGLPRLATVARVVPSAFDEGTVYAAFDNHREDDNRPYVYLSTDHGTTWRAIIAGIPDGQAVRTITEDIRNPNVLYVGTEFGLFVSLNKGARWMQVKANLPTVPIAEITMHPRENDLLLATHGRSIWILDDATPFQQAATAMAAAPYLFDARPTASYSAGSFRPNFAGPGDRRFWGKNPEPGAALTYYLGTPARDVSLRVRDASGNVVRDLSADAVPGAKEAGVTRIHWDLRYAPIPDSLMPAGRGGGGGGGRGGLAPFVLPGEYRVQLVVDGRAGTTRAVRVAGDPLVRITDPDRRLWHDAALALHELQPIAAEAAAKIAALSERLRTVQGLVQGAQRAPQSLTTAVADLDRRLATLRRQFAVPAPGQAPPPGRGGGAGGVPPVPNQIATVKNQLLAATSRPTEAQLRLSREALEDLTKAVDEINHIIGSGLPAVYQALGQPQLQPAIAPMAPVAVRVP
jgi:photosystem II stability/assembly factor-like uncharacterized protein